MKSRALASSLLVVTLAAAILGSVAEAKTKPAAATKAAAVSKSDIVGWVNGQPITRQELEGRLEDLPPAYRAQFATPEGRQKLLDAMIEERVWTLAAEKAGVPNRPEIARQLEQQRNTTVIRSYLGEVMQGAPAPNDSLVQVYFEAHKNEAPFQTPEARRVRHIQLATEAEARAVLTRLRKGADFAALAKTLSKDAATKEAGGELGRVERLGGVGSLGRQPAIADSAFAVAKGAYAGPIKSPIGWHVIQVEDTIAPAPVAMEEARPRILSLLNREVQEKFYKDQLDKAKVDAGLRWNQAVVDSFLHGKKSPSELFRDAQDATTPDDRVTGYEHVVTEYPASEQAPQAQFMIGFVYSEEKKDYDKAEAAFRKLIKEYPRSELAHSAQWMLDNMRTDALPNFDLPGGVKRAGDAGATSEPKTTKK
jgi:peptidyl-prolyl cis-trans isomerase C